ncbi:unnamed protein product, partial [marine sediment metagenome]
RASPGWYYDSAGVLTEAAINAPRFDHDPDSKVPLGLRLEDERTNVFLNSAAPVTQDITLTAQAYSVSMRGAGSITLSGANTGVATEAAPLIIALASAGLTTFTVTGATFGQVEWAAASNDASAPSTSIVTQGVPVTRDADLCFTNDVSWYNPVTGTFYAEMIRNIQETGRVIWQVSDGSNNNRWGFETSSTQRANLALRENATNTILTSSNDTFPLGATAKMASAIGNLDLEHYLNGLRVLTGRQTAGVPIGVNLL